MLSRQDFFFGEPICKGGILMKPCVRLILSLARALLPERPMIILDEAFAGVEI